MIDPAGIVLEPMYVILCDAIPAGGLSPEAYHLLVRCPPGVPPSKMALAIIKEVYCFISTIVETTIRSVP